MCHKQERMWGPRGCLLGMARGRQCNASICPFAHSQDKRGGRLPPDWRRATPRVTTHALRSMLAATFFPFPFGGLQSGYRKQSATQTPQQNAG